MEPFRALLKTKGAKLKWKDDIEQAFKESKEVINEAVNIRVQLFDIKKKTSTDWCKSGVGFIVLQKHCRCTAITPKCSFHQNGVEFCKDFSFTFT